MRRTALSPMVRTRRLKAGRHKAPGSVPVTLEVMNPRGDLAPRPVLEPAARVKDIAGKKIGIYWNGKAGADNLLDVVAELLKEKFPLSTILRYDGPLDAGDVRAAAMSSEADIIIYGVGD